MAHLHLPQGTFDITGTSKADLRQDIVRAINAGGEYTASVQTDDNAFDITIYFDRLDWWGVSS